jgi:plasmid maintenance system antidote protein VapI
VSFYPDYIVAPGETIKDLLRRRRMTQKDFFLLMGMAPSDGKDLLSGRTVLTRGIARRLSYFLGASVQFWLNREKHFRTCARHPRYKAIHPPRRTPNHPEGCKRCWAIYKHKHNL